MKWNLIVSSLVLALGMSTQSFGFELLDQLLGVSGCCNSGCCEASCGAPACCDSGCAAADPACGCPSDPACGCPAEPACCDAAPCCKPKCKGLLHNLLGHKKCCASACEPACGCPEACDTGCPAACDSGCAAADPACGCAAADPACGCEVASCCDPCGKKCGGLLGRLFGHKKSCGLLEASCGCPEACDSGCAADPSCGCASAAPACGCGAAPVVAPAAPVVQPTPAAPEAAAAPTDPSASVARKLRVRNASQVIRFGR